MNDTDKTHKWSTVGGSARYCRLCGKVDAGEMTGKCAGHMTARARAAYSKPSQSYSYGYGYMLVLDRFGDVVNTRFPTEKNA